MNLLIIQARMGSTRLPGKVLADIAGKSMLERVVERSRAANKIDKLIVATSDEAADDAIESACREFSVTCFRGDQDDVLSRFYGAAQDVRPDIVVRATGDCPFIDPEVIDQVTGLLESSPGVDYVSNTQVRTFPHGLDVEAMRFTALEQAWQEATEPYQRSHVTPYLYEHPESYQIRQVTMDEDYSSLRWTVDTPEDLQFAREVYSRAGTDHLISWRRVLEIVKSNPGLSDINSEVKQKELHEG